MRKKEVILNYKNKSRLNIYCILFYFIFFIATGILSYLFIYNEKQMRCVFQDCFYTEEYKVMTLIYENIQLKGNLGMCIKKYNDLLTKKYI